MTERRTDTPGPEGAPAALQPVEGAARRARRRKRQVPPGPDVVYLERRGSRGALFYEARLEQAGPSWRLVRRWGYLGQRGWRRVALFENQEAARAALARLARRRAREGYLPGPGAQLPLLGVAEGAS
ncbi:MAG: WGR domain-containing protein [Armatimonadetes bacterium]|nr:WGR domain-containing protein [Armatimonadota bacterium]